jgi:Na+/H+-translocating membrane pyrophosphatase
VSLVLGWLLAVAFGAGGAWAVWKRALEKGQARKDVERELSDKAKEMKQHEASILAEPAGDKRAVLERMRKNRKP